MKRRRVKITGIGPVTPAGIGREAFWKGILEPVSRVRPFTKLPAELGEFAAAYLDRVRIDDYLPDCDLPRGAARHTLFAVAGAALALRDAGLSLDEIRRLSIGVVVGSSLMDFEGIGRTIEGFSARGLRGIVPRTVFSTNASVIPATISAMFRLTGKSVAIQTSCCAGMDAIGTAVRMIEAGEIDLALCGGAEAPLFRCPLVELRATGLTPATAENARGLDRPFDLWRTTGVVSEGAAMLILEPEESSRAGYALIAGYGSATDLADDTCGGLTDAVRFALSEARMAPADVDAISAWGPGHRVVDAAEAKALERVFGDRLRLIPALSIKGALGNALGAAPAIQIAAAALALKDGILPPTVNWASPDPDCLLNLAARARAIAHDVTLVDAHGLSGVNSAMILRRCQP